MWRLWSNGLQCAQDSELSILSLALVGDHNGVLFLDNQSQQSSTNTIKASNFPMLST